MVSHYYEKKVKDKNKTGGGGMGRHGEEVGSCTFYIVHHGLKLNLCSALVAPVGCISGRSQAEH